MPSIPVLCLPPSRVDPKVLGRTSSSITLSQVDLGRPGGLRQFFVAPCRTNRLVRRSLGDSVSLSVAHSLLTESHTHIHTYTHSLQYIAESGWEWLRRSSCSVSLINSLSIVSRRRRRSSSWWRCWADDVRCYGCCCWHWGCARLNDV